MQINEIHEPGNRRIVFFIDKITIDTYCKNNQSFIEKYGIELQERVEECLKSVMYGRKQYKR